MEGASGDEEEGEHGVRVRNEQRLGEAGGRVSRLEVVGRAELLNRKSI